MAFLRQFSRSFQAISSVSIFDFSIRFLLVFLPFSSFISVFLTYKIGIPGSSFIKEIIFWVAILALIYSYIKSYISDKKYVFRLGYLDYFIIFYILLMLWITVFTTGIRGMVFWGRYDFAFLIIFLVAYHGYPLLQKPISYYLKIFLISSGSMLFLSWLLKWPLQEDILLYFWYSGNPSNWDFWWAPPIFHGIDGANVRRFQWLLDGPNTMWAFLIIFTGILTYFTRFRKDWYFVIALVVIWLLGMVFYTYSRSAMIGVILAFLIVIFMSLRSLWQLYRFQLISVFLILAFLMGIVWVFYYDRWIAIVGRAGSTKGHAERMIVGAHRVMENPLGQWLGSAGPAYRHVIDISNNPIDMTELDRFYIPESWYIQQFIEGWYLGGIVFLIIILSLFGLLICVHPILGALFAGVGVMNLFLHTFESSVVSLLLFLIIGIILGHRKYAKK